ncbi:MAG: hypothetical protein BWK73_50910 [Thiothrix lacustris]|uniref:Uncharacterized protein n=1 Tax=Thiothrix lacustris TaxID=525917 RepID=A0A1Y1Q890_9GAMM|nr:MAG: hypothetical protein BWK73_50910 [Thiothrix lacustris]
MKTYFLAIFLILNSITALAGDYIKDKEQGSLVWDNKPSNDTAASWIGNVDKDNFSDGFGLAIWYKNNVFQVGYFGTMQRGKFNGLVKSFDLTGNYKQGNWIDGNRGSDWKKITDQSLKKLAKSDIENSLNLVRGSYENPEKNTNQNNVYSFDNFLNTFNPALLETQKNKNTETVFEKPDPISSANSSQEASPIKPIPENIKNILSQLFEGESLFNKGKYSQIQIEAIFDQKFKDKEVMLFGEITNISKNFSGDKYITIKATDNHFFDVYPSEDFNVLDYNKGQSVTFIGRWTKVGTGIMINHIIKSAILANN